MTNPQLQLQLSERINLPDQVFPPMKGLGKAHSLNAVHQWLCNAMGAHPDDLVITDPVQQLQVTVDLRPLIAILGGEWAAMLQRAITTKTQNSSGAVKRGIQTEGEEGNFLAGLKRKPAPRDGTTEFTRSAAVALGVTGKAIEAENAEAATSATVPVLDPDVTKLLEERDARRAAPKYVLQKADGSFGRCGVCACNIFLVPDEPLGAASAVIACAECGDATLLAQIAAGFELKRAPSEAR